MGTISTIDTHAVAPGERLEYWVNKMGDLLSPKLSIDSKVDHFDGQILHTMLGRIGFARIFSSEVSVSWPGNNLADCKEHTFVLHIQNSGHCRFRQDGYELLLQTGDLTFCDNARPYSLEVSSNNDMLVLDLPVSILSEKLPQALSRVMEVEPCSNPNVRLLNNFLLNVWQECNSTAEQGEWIDGLEDVLLDMLSLTLRRSNCEPVTIDGPSRLQTKIMASIQEKLSDPRLSTPILAKEAGISVRTVQTLFARMGTTPTAFILQQRLALAAKLLRSLPEKRITDIAYDSGFNDSAYFTRRFRQYFGQSPRQFRLR